MKKGVVLVIVIGISFVVLTLALISIYIMTNEARIAEHKVKRIRNFFRAQGAIVHVFERLRKEGTRPNVLADIERDKPLGVEIKVTPRGRPNDPTCPCPDNAPSDFCICASVPY